MAQIKTKNKEYYTAKQVKEKLAITNGELYNYVRNGNLQRVTPPGKKQGVYLRREVDVLANELQSFYATRITKSYKFERATEDDLPEIIEISKGIFGQGGQSVIPLEIRAQWLRKNPETFFVLKDEGHIVGYTSLLPLKREKVDKLVTEEESSENITFDEVERFEPGKPLHIYIMAIGVDMRTSLSEKRIYGWKLINGLFDFLIELGKRGILVETITARSYKPDGIRVLRHVGFPEVPSPVIGKRLFVIKVAESGIPLIQRYHEALEEYQGEGH